MVRYGQFPLSTFIAMSWEVLAPIEPAGRTADEVVAESESAIKAALGQGDLS
jgi:1-acyl-sn-glycerol-3-phosphate acyltransferase